VYYTYIPEDHFYLGSYKVSASTTSLRRVSILILILFITRRRLSLQEHSDNSHFSFRDLNISSSAASLFLIIPLIVNRQSQEVRSVDQAFGSFMCVVFVCTYVYVCMYVCMYRECTHAFVCRTSLNGFRSCDILMLKE